MQTALQEMQQSLVAVDIAAENAGLRYRSTYQGGPYPEGRFGRSGTLWETDANYRSGQVRAERLVHDVAREAGVEVATLVDEIIYVPGAEAPFFTVQNGRRILALNEGAVFGRDSSLRQIKALHELAHAMIEDAGGNVVVFTQYADPRLRYYAEEVFVESFARRTLESSLSRRALVNSIQYENFYRRRLGLPEIPIPPAQ